MAIESYRGPYNQILNMFLNPAERAHGLLSGSEDRADITNMLLMELIDNIKALSSAGSGGDTYYGGDTSVNVKYPSLEVKSASVLDSVSSVSTNEIKPANLVDVKKAVRILLVVNNGLNQTVQVKVKGNTTNIENGSSLIYSFNIDAGERGSYGFKTEDWSPFVGCTITPLAVPSQGTVSANVWTQEVAINEQT